MDEKYLSVFALNKYIKARMDSDYQLQDVMIKGEISNYRPHPSGHMYFTLKDENASVNAIMFASNAKRMAFHANNGDKVLVRGYVSVYEKTGQYQLYIREMSRDGLGNLFIQFEELKKKLSSEGLFNEEHKKPIPTIPQRIAVLSAKQGAALQDVLRTIKGRFPAARIIIFPIPVQGKGAFIKIIETLKGIDQLNFSTILLVRGGGSIEDLWNFNEEALVRCIYELKTPIITGVGHETDFTLVDFVSDLRCATPTAAAVAATPHVDELTESVVHKKVQLQTLLTRRLEIERQHLNHLRSHYFFKDPHRLIENDLLKMMQYKNKLDAFHDKFMISHQSIIKKKLQTLSYLMNQTIAKEQFSYMKKIEKLDLVSPLKTLARGYALVKKDDKLVDSVNMLSKGDKVELTLKDGHVEAEIK